MKNSTHLMFIFWGVMITSSIIEVLFIKTPNTSAFAFASIVVTTGFMFAWFMADARDIGREPSRWLKVGVLALGIIFVPYYLIKFKGFQRALISFAKFVGLFAIYMVMVAVFEYLHIPNA